MELNETFNKAVEASRALNLTDVSRIDAVLLALADAAEAKMEFILEANRRDLALMDEQNPMYDRLMLTPERIRGIAADIRNVASLPSPLGHVLDEVVRPNGMKITKKMCIRDRIKGYGAGAGVTAAGVFADIISIANIR